MDPLSEVLSLLKLTMVQAGSFGIERHAAFEFHPHDGIKCYAVVSGSCWVCVEGVSEATELTQGDCVLLPRGRSFTLAADLSATGKPFSPDVAGRLSEAMDHAESGGPILLGSHFLFAGNQSESLLRALPPLIHVRKDTGRKLMRSSLEGMAEELANPQPGGSLVAQQLASVLLVQSLRQFLQEQMTTGAGWLHALADKQLQPAFLAIHGDPRHAWTLQKLASRAGMSRTVFAQRFRRRVGLTAMNYLMRWRMLVAGERLQSSNASIAEVALSVGYEAESAFGRAFKKVWLCSPKQHRQRLKT